MGDSKMRKLAISKKKIAWQATALVFIGFFLGSLLFVPCALAQYFTIERFHSDIVVREDAKIRVTETIEVKFDRPRHGIYREIPFKYQDELGRVIRTPIHVLAVTNGSGGTWKYRVSKSGPVLHIRIGDPNRFVDGRRTYVITYEVENVLLFLKDHDELYWNVTGNFWKAPIKEASAEVSLAVRGENRSSLGVCYTGVYGSSESECLVEPSGNRVRFVAKRNLRTGEGLTIAFGWDKGLVREPSSWRRFLWTIDIGENWVFLLPLFSLVGMITCWYRRGRDPRLRESLTVQYEPPKYETKPLSAAEVGTLLDEKFDPRDMTASIVGLAVKGYLQIEETKREGLIFSRTEHSLRRLKPADSNLSLFEAELMRGIFPDERTISRVSELRNRFYTQLPGLRKVLYGELVRKGYFTSSPESVRNRYVATGIVVIIFGSLLLVLLTGLAGKGIVSSLLSAVPIFIIGRAMPAKTKEGALAHWHVLGFQEFLNRAEKDRLERMGDKELFSKYLPYAMALDVTENWARAFEGIYQSPPHWYVSSTPFPMFSPYGFSHSLQSVSSNLSSALFSAPRGSGMGGGGRGGGGGFSGGGSGGGGGGSW